MKPFYVFTGGPGSGKTTVLNALARLGYCVVPEGGRAIIKEQVAQQGEALPWKNKQLFFELMLTQSLQEYKQQPTEGVVFFDRGVLDSIGYAQLEQLSIKPEHEALARDIQDAKTVFLFPPWQAIYTQDTERKQTFEIAIQTYDVMKKIYVEWQYQVVEVPCVSVDERVKFILEYLHLTK